MRDMGALRAGALVGLVGCAVPLAAEARPHAAPPIAATPLIVAWTTPSLLSGAFVGARHDDLVQLEERRCRSTQFTPFLQVPSDPQGGWHVYVAPPITTTYRARFRDDVSGTVTVQVRPSVTIRELARGRFLVTTLAFTQFWRATGVFERFSSSRGRWVRVKTFVLSESGPTTGTSSVTNGRFRSRLPRGTLVRALLPSSQTRPCYQAGVSNMLRTR
jgi:hypothetical protein